MIIGLDKLLPRVRRGELIQNLSDRELTNPEGAGFDLRAGEIYEICSGGTLGIKTRESSNTKLVGKFDKAEKTSVTLMPTKYYLVKIMESICLDPDMIGFFHPRSTLLRCGVVLQTGVHPPGYSGEPTFGLCVQGPYPFVLELGSRIAHINILRIDGESSAYRGQWQGGRVSTEGPETQV